MKFPFVIIILFLLLMPSCAYAGSVVEVARSQIGKGEIGGDNRGPQVKKYTKGKEVPWCAGFVSFVLAKGKGWDLYHLRALSFWEDHRLNRVKFPKPGDVIVFKRGYGKGHVGIVETVDKGKITTIEGNVGPYPARVKRKTYQIGNIKNLIGFVRI